MKYYWSDLPAAIARLPLVAKVLLAFVGAALVLFIATPPSHHFIRSSAADEAAPTTKLALVVQAVPVQDKAEAENTLTQSRMPEPIRLQHPEVQSNGTIKNGDAYFVLADVTRFTRKDVCTHSSGEKWACGLEAYATFHNMIAGQAIECIPRKAEGKNTIASCYLGSSNLAAELLKRGLVKMQPDVSNRELQEAQEYAKSRRLGVWQ